MKELKGLINRIADRVNINLRESDFDAGSYVRELIPWPKFKRFYGFYGVTGQHPLHFHFNDSCVAGSYFLGKTQVDHSVVYKSDVRGDELKRKGQSVKCGGKEIALYDDEMIRIKDSYLIKNLVHSNSHDPECPEEFLIQNTISMHYANIHGAPVEGSFLGPFSTIDLTTVHDCVIGAYAYVQSGELSHRRINDGQIYIHAGNAFEFDYTYDPEVLKRYVAYEIGQKPTGALIDLLRTYKRAFKGIFEKVEGESEITVPASASLSRYAVVKGKTTISDNVLVAQRAYLENAWLGPGSNAQENCYIINSRLSGCDVTAHGGKIIHAELGKKVFVGFNSLLRGTPENPLKIGEGSIVMPHTIMDLEEPVEIPAHHLVWGYIRNRKDLKSHSVELEKMSKTDGQMKLGNLKFKGKGSAFVHGFEHRIEHILEANGAFCSDRKRRGHAQMNRNISYNILQPYLEGSREGLFPTIDIKP